MGITMTAQATPNPRPGVIAVTGASNYLGLGIMRRMIDDESVTRIVAIDTRKPDLEHAKIVFYKVDLTNPSAQQILSRVFINEGVGRVLHLIFTYTLSRNRMLSHELEAIGTMHVLDACFEAGVNRIVARSTTAIYGAAPKNPNFLTEAHEPAEHSEESFVYDKLELERQMLQYGVQHADARVVILRDCTSLGESSINYLSSLLLARRTPRVLGFDPLMQFIHEDDLFRAYHLVVMGDAAGVYNIVGKGVVRYSEAIKRLDGNELVLPERLLRTGTRLLWNLRMYDIPASFLDHIKYPWVADGTKAARELGFVPDFDCFRALDDALHTRRLKTT
jgi:UDP-glucose 4-epimerase